LKIYRLSQLINAIEDGFLVVLLSSLIGLAITQIILRNVFDSGISWAEPLLKILVLWVGLAGAMVATRYNQHITINVIARYLPEHWQQLTAFFTSIFTATVTAIISYHAGRFVLMDKEAQSIAFADIPSWWCELIIPLAFGIITIRFLGIAISQARQFLQSIIQ
jgi:TRAP-type C4-dicarboxylate transport system permease small subunit